MARKQRVNQRKKHRGQKKRGTTDNKIDEPL